MTIADAFIPGFLLGFSLILAIGAQNAFVLKQGLQRTDVLAVCATCAVSDALLICAGVAGFGALAERAPWFEQIMRYAGAGFLLWYGWGSARAAWRGGQALATESGRRVPVVPTVLTALALTWLNPHVYLDTVVLLGSISAQYADRAAFAAGAVTASFIFFFSLGYGARLLAPVFARPKSWQWLEAVVALTMWAIAYKLLFP